MIHATREELHRLRSGALDSSKMLIVSRHVASCPDCGNLALEEIGIGPAARELRAAIGESDEHPDLEAGLFAYVDRTVNEEDRAGIERHLEQCPVCREDVEDAREVRRSIARPRTDEPAKPIQAWTTGDTQRRVGLRRWMQAALAAALTLAVGVTAVWMVRVATTTGQGTAATGEQHPIQSMAVIPMKNVSNSSSDDFLAVAVADALTTRLQKIPSLLVRPTSAVLANSRGANESGLASGAVLGVDCLLQGQYVTTGSLVRVSLQLIDSRTGASLWADRVDGPRDDLLELIEALNLRTVSALDEKLGVQPATRGAEPRSANPKAFEEYLKARALQGSLIPAEFAEQRAHLKRAVELDPNFAAAYADLAIAMSIAEVRGLMDDPHAPQEALGYARKAVSLDPGLAVAHLALGRTIARLPHGFSESAHENLTALRLSALEPAPIGTLGSIFGRRHPGSSRSAREEKLGAGRQ